MNSILSNGTPIDEGTKEHHRTTKNLTAGSTRITKLSLSIDTKEAQALLLSYLDGLDDWQLVPKDPTEEMHHAARDWSVEKYGKAIGFEASCGCYKAMLAAAPKYEVTK